MLRLPRIVLSLLLTLCLTAPLWTIARAAADDATPAAGASATPADNSTPAAQPADTTATAAQPADNTAQAPPSLVDLVDSYWHYGKIADYALAADSGQKILSSGADSKSILEAFENVTARKNDTIDTWMLRWRTLPVTDETDKAAIQAMRDVSNKLNEQINQGYATRSNDPQFIQQTITEMSLDSRAYDNNMPRIAKSGEVAVKVIIDILRDTQQRPLHTTCRRILRDLGRRALNPLLAATEMKDYDTLVDVISALGDLGYDASVPYLARLEVDQTAPQAIHIASRNALQHLGTQNASTIDPAYQFFNLAEKCYYGKSDIEPAGDKISYIWYWTTDLGLQRKDVPTQIFNDLLAMRAAEYTLKLDPAYGDAVSLWLAANTRREVDLPAGAADPTHAGDPDANYYNVSAGGQFLNDALARSIRDHDAAVAFRLCQSMRDIVGQRNLAGTSAVALEKCLYFPNRQVRYQAAFALAQALPAKPFPGSDRVVPLLVEAINQTNKPGILVIAPPASDSLSVGDLRDAVQSLGFPVVTATNPNEGAAAAITLPTIDFIIISEDSDVAKMIDLEQQIGRLQGSSMLVLTHTPQSAYAVQSATDPLMNTAVMPPKASLKENLAADIESAREHSGIAVMTAQEAADYALQAASQLQTLAMTRGHALDVSVAEAGLLVALNDTRPEIAKAAGRVLGTLNSPSSQSGLAMKANQPSTPADVRVSLYHSLADSAKHLGNRLDSQQIALLEKVVSGDSNSSVRDAAAEARGALDLPADRARDLILKQSRV